MRSCYITATRWQLCACRTLAACRSSSAGCASTLAMAASSAEAKKILAALPLMSFELDALFAKAKGPRLTLQLPTVSGLPFFLADLPEPAFAAVVALCEAGLLSFATVGAKEGKILLLASGLQPRCPVVTVDAQPGVQYLLPMRLVPGVAAGAPGGGGAGRFFSAGAAGTAFRCGGGRAPPP